MAQSLTQRPEWKSLQDHLKLAEQWHMRELFAKDPRRFEKFRSVTLHVCCEGGGVAV